MILFGISILASLSVAIPLKPVHSIDLAAALCYQHELANTFKNRDAPFTVRVYDVVTEINECGGPISSCPDVDLYVAASETDLGSKPVLYRLPRGKGWEFVRWLSTCPGTADDPMVGLVVRTALPDVGFIDPDVAAKWHSTEYEVCVSPRTASYATKQHN